MTARFTRAISLAARAHEGQVRKGAAIPYITHPVAVAGLVALYAGGEDQQIAAVLHDVLEHGGQSLPTKSSVNWEGGCLPWFRDALTELLNDWETRAETAHD